MVSETDDLRYRSATWRLRGRYGLLAVLGLLIISTLVSPTPAKITLYVLASLVWVASCIWITRGLRLMRREWRLRKEQRH